MTQPGRLLLTTLLASGLAAGGYTYRRGQASQAVRLGYISAVADQITINNERRAEANAAVSRSVAHFVCLNHSQPADVAVLTQTQQIRARTQALIDTLNLLRRQLRSTTASPALASPLRAQVNRYQAFMQRYYPETTLTRSAAGAAAEGWRGQPLPVVLATLTRLEAQLRRYEAQALQTQAEKMASHYDGFDTIGALAVPVAETVAPGGTYQARLFLAQFGHRDFCNMEMTANGAPLTLPNAPGMQVQFTVPHRRPGQADTVRAQWHGTIRGSLLPSDTLLQLDVPYLIVSPPTP